MTTEHQKLDRSPASPFARLLEPPGCCPWTDAHSSKTVIAVIKGFVFRRSRPANIPVHVVPDLYRSQACFAIRPARHPITGTTSPSGWPIVGVQVSVQPAGRNGAGLDVRNYIAASNRNTLNYSWQRSTGDHDVPALQKALSILEMLANARVGLALPEIVKRSGLPKSSVHCILVTLQGQEYLYRNESTGRYMFGMKLFSLINKATSGLKLREQSARYLLALMQQTRLTVHMAILEQSEAVLVAKFEARENLRLASWIGKRMEVHCTALGKALIACFPEEELDNLLRDRALPKHNENTISSAKRLKEDLAKSVKRGYAIDDEEDELGFRCPSSTTQVWRSPRLASPERLRRLRRTI
jgi:DNA-binding IclR family transcriptional regulator